MLTYKKAFEQLYIRQLQEYYSGDYVPLLIEGESHAKGQVVFREFKRDFVDFIYDILQDDSGNDDSHKAA